MEERLIVDLFTEEQSHWWHHAKRALITGFITDERLRILVAGVGGGMLCKELQDAGHDVVGVDISAAACEHLGRLMGKPALCEDLEKPLGFADGSFDLIIVADVLEHLVREREFLFEAFRCLAPSGRIVITAPAYAHIWSRWDERSGHQRRYIAAGLAERLTTAGFTMVKLSYYHMFLYPVAFVFRKIFSRWRVARKCGSEFSGLSRFVPRWLAAPYYAVERWCIRHGSLPFGLSLLAIGVKRG
jgi:SAM-dependent methyltransferase